MIIDGYNLNDYTYFFHFIRVEAVRLSGRVNMSNTKSVKDLIHYCFPEGEKISEKLIFTFLMNIDECREFFQKTFKKDYKKELKEALHYIQKFKQYWSDEDE